MILKETLNAFALKCKYLWFYAFIFIFKNSYLHLLHVQTTIVKEKRPMQPNVLSYKQLKTIF